MKAAELSSARLVYKPLSLAHLSQEYVNWMNDPVVICYLESGGNYTIDMLRDYLREVEEKDSLFWAIHTLDTGEHIGNIKIDPVNERHGIAEYGIMMGKRSEWGKKYATEASQTIIEHCFGELGIRKITLGVVADNTLAYRLYVKLGFQIEGRYRNHGIYEGKYCDVIRMAIFNPFFAYNN